MYGHSANNKISKDHYNEKTLLSLAAFSAFGFASVAHAEKVDICVFDLLGKSGESFQMAQEWALAAKGWGADINLIARQDEAVADNDFKAGKCDGVFMTAMRARQYNKFAGSIDALGGAPNNAIAQRAISFALDKRNAGKMVTNMGGKNMKSPVFLRWVRHLFLFVIKISIRLKKPQVKIRSTWLRRCPENHGTACRCAGSNFRCFQLCGQI